MSKLSRPKNQIRFLLLEGISQSAVQALNVAGYTNIQTMTKALDTPALIEALQGVHMLGVRSRTQVTKEVLEKSRLLAAVGCFSVGTNQSISMRRACAAWPYSMRRSRTRAALPNSPSRDRDALPWHLHEVGRGHEGRWIKSATDSHEVRGKTLGLVGYGNIGTQVAMLAEAMGMRVIYFDRSDKLRHGNVEPASTLDELLTRSDVVSLHLPETPDTLGIIGERELALMRKGSYLINNARGTLVDIDALASALSSGHLRGAAVDVFPVEPKSNADEFKSPLRGLDNVILTPHVGGSTEEAQERIGDEVARRLIEYSDVGSTIGAVNFPQVQLSKKGNVTRFIQCSRTRLANSSGSTMCSRAGASTSPRKATRRTARSATSCSTPKAMWRAQWSCSKPSAASPARSARVCSTGCDCDRRRLGPRICKQRDDGLFRRADVIVDGAAQARGISRFHRLDDRQMRLRDAMRVVVELADERDTGAHLRRDLVECAQDARIAAHGAEQAMEGEILEHLLLDGALIGQSEHQVHLAPQRGDLVRPDLRERNLRGIDLEPDPQFVDLAQIRWRQRAHEEAAARTGLHEPLAFQETSSLAHGRTARSEIAGKMQFVEARPWRQLAADDRLGDLPGDDRHEIGLRNRFKHRDRGCEKAWMLIN